MYVQGIVLRLDCGGGGDGGIYKNLQESLLKVHRTTHTHTHTNEHVKLVRSE